MWLLDKPTKSLRLKTQLAPSLPLQVDVAYNQQSRYGANVNLGPVSKQGLIDNSVVDFIAPPVQDQIFHLSYLSVYNRAAADQLVSIVIHDTIGAVNTLIHKVNIPIEGRAEYNEGCGWKIYDANGNPVAALSDLTNKDVQEVSGLAPFTTGSATFVDITGLTRTTKITGYNRNYSVNTLGVFSVDNIDTGAEFQILVDGTSVRVCTYSNGDILRDLQFSLRKALNTIGDAKVVKVQVRVSSGTGNITIHQHSLDIYGENALNLLP